MSLNEHPADIMTRAQFKAALAAALAERMSALRKRPKAKARREVVKYAYLCIDRAPTVPVESIRGFNDRNDAVRDRAARIDRGYNCGAIVPVSLPAPKGKK